MSPSIEIQPTNYAPSSGGCGLGGFLEVENLWAKYVCSSGGQTTHTLRLKSDLTTDWFDVDTAFPTLNVSNAGDWMVCLYTNGSCVAYAMAVLAQEGSSAWQTHILLWDAEGNKRTLNFSNLLGITREGGTLIGMTIKP